MRVKIAEDGLTLIAEEEKENALLSKLWNNALMLVSSYSENGVTLKGCKITQCLSSIVSDISTEELVEVMEGCLKELSKRIEEIEIMFNKVRIWRG